MNRSSKKIIIIVIVFILLSAGYSVLWHQTADLAVREYNFFLSDISNTPRADTEIGISGFPGKINLFVESDAVELPQGRISFENLVVRGWPVPYLPVEFTTGPITLYALGWRTPLEIDDLKGKVRYLSQLLTVMESTLNKGGFKAGLDGTVNLRQEPFPELDLMLSIENHAPFLAELAQKKVITDRMAMFMTAGFNAFADENGIVRVPITQRGETLYAGPIPVGSLPALRRPARGNRPAPGR